MERGEVGENPHSPKTRRAPDCQMSFEVEGALVVEEFEVAENVGFDFGGFGFGVDGLEFGDDFADGALAVATLDDFEARAIEAKGAFGHEQDLLAVVLAEADAGGEAGM
jgi:hypothetical protein